MKGFITRKCNLLRVRDNISSLVPPVIYIFLPLIIDIPCTFFAGCMPGHPQVGLEGYSVFLGTFSLRFHCLLIVNSVGEVILDPFEWVRISYQGTQAALLINIFHNLV